MKIARSFQVYFLFFFAFFFSVATVSHAATCIPVDWLKTPSSVATFYYKNDKVYDDLILIYKGGNSPWNARVVSGSIPPGMSLKVVPFTGGYAADGRSGNIHITGQPTVEGDYFPVIQLSDSCPNGAQSATYRIQIQVRCGVFKFPDGVNLPPAGIGKPYSFQFKTTCDPKYDSHGFSAYVGTEPPGLKLSDSGLLSGTPTKIGSYNPKIIATLYGSNPQTISKIFPLQVIDNTPPTLTYFGAANNTLGSQGGNIDVTVRANDNGLLRFPQINVTYPDGTTRTVYAGLTSGSYSSGEFKATITLPANNTKADQIYKVSGMLFDTAGNKTVCPTFTIKVSSVIARVQPPPVKPIVPGPGQRLPIR